MIRRIVSKVRKCYKQLNIANVNSEIKNEIFSEILANENLIAENPTESCELFRYLYLNGHKNTPLIELDSKNLYEDYMIYKLLLDSICNYLNSKNGLLDTRLFNSIHYLSIHFSQNNFIPRDYLKALNNYYKNNCNVIINHYSDIIKDNNTTKIINCSTDLSVCGLGNKLLLEKMLDSIDNSNWILNISEKIQSIHVLSTIYTTKSYFGNGFNWLGDEFHNKNQLGNTIKKLMSIKHELITSVNALALLPIFAHLEYKTGILDSIGKILLERYTKLSLWNAITIIDSLYKLDCRFSTLLTKLSLICLEQIDIIPVDLLIKIAIQLYDLNEPEQLLIPQISLKMDEIIAKNVDIQILDKFKTIFNSLGIKNISLDNYYSNL